MRFDPELETGILLARYKRFFADVGLEDGSTLTLHCANTGSMRGCSAPGAEVAYSCALALNRKLPGTLELIRIGGRWVGVHPARANALVAEACSAGRIELWRGLGVRRREVVVPGSDSRFDLELGAASEPRWIIEVKSVSWVEQGVAWFPDAPSARARKHAVELARLACCGERVALVFCVQRSDARVLRPAWEVDPGYGEALRAAAAAGVVLRAFACEVSPAEIRLAGDLPVDLGL